jgi:hypothetical protein
MEEEEELLAWRESSPDKGSLKGVGWVRGGKLGRGEGGEGGESVGFRVQVYDVGVGV